MKKTTSLSPLSLILNHLHITAVDLAAAIHVDPSLISRWRNNNRHFDTSSDHYVNTLNYIVDRDERLSYQNIAIFLMDYMPKIEIKTREEAYHALELWMSGHIKTPRQGTVPTSIDEMNVADVGILKGEGQKKEALLYALDTSLMLPDKKRLFLMFDDTTDQMLEQKSFYELWIQRLHEIIQKGHEIYFIYSSDIFRSNIVELDHFLSLCFSPNFHAYYMPKGAMASFDLYILEDVLALTGFTASPGAKRNMLCSFTHPDIVKRLQLQYKTQLHCCKPLVNHSEEKIKQVAVTLKGIQHMEQKLYIYDSTPFVFPISPSLFEKILTHNNFDADAVNSIMSRYLTFIYHPFLKGNGNDTRILLNIEEIFHALDKPQYVLFPKLLSNQEIILPKKYYILYLKEIFHYISSPEDFEISADIAMVSDAYSGLPKNTIVYAIDNLCTYINSYASGDIQKYLLFTNPVITTDAFQYLDHLGNNLPEENRNATYLLLMVNQMLEKVSS